VQGEPDSESSAWSSKPGGDDETKGARPSACSQEQARKAQFQTPSHPEGESAGQREETAYWRLPSLQPVTVKGTSAHGTRVALRGAPYDHEPRPVSTLSAQTICAKRWTPVTRVPRRQPRSAPTRCRHAVTVSFVPSGARVAEGAALSVSSPPVRVSGSKDLAIERELGEPALSKERTWTFSQGKERVGSKARGGLRSSSRTPCSLVLSVVRVRTSSR
jgi:hypothetical protein